MRKRIPVLIIGIFFGLNSSMAWDEVTHAFITNKVIDKVSIPELKKLLESNKDFFLSGSWFTDSYQYTDTRINTLNPHNLDIYVNAYLSYLQKEEVREQENYEKLVAFFFGSVAHTTEDFWLDNILYEYPETVGDSVTGDTYNGVIAINKFDYLDLKVFPYFPCDDLYLMFSDAGMIEPEYDTQDKFENMFKSLITKQYEQLRLLKLLSFLASNQVQNKSPWISANIMNAPGGIQSSATNTAIYMEALWMELNGQNVPGVLNSTFFLPDKSLGMLVCFPEKIEKEQLNLLILNSDKDTLIGVISAFQDGGTMANLYILVFQIDTEVELPEGAYTASIGIQDSVGIQYDHMFHISSDNKILQPAQEQISGIRSLGAGLFLFILCIGIAGLIWGLSSLHLFILSIRKGSIRLPLWSRILQRGLQLLGVVVFVFGLYLFLTQGWLVVLNV